MRRNVFVTVEMLRTAGLDADVRSVYGLIEVRLDERCATFPAAKAGAAADWLAACVVMNYPDSDLSKVWIMLANLAGGAIPFASR
jgi:hypothetical protein